MTTTAKEYAEMLIKDKIRWRTISPSAPGDGAEYHIIHLDTSDGTFKVIATGIPELDLAEFICSKKDEYLLHQLYKNQEK